MNSESKPSRVRTDVFWSASAELTYALSQFVVLSAIAHFYGVTEVGIYGYAVAVATPLFLAARLGLKASLATDIKNEYLFGHYFALIIVSASIAFIITVSIGALSSKNYYVASIFSIVSATKFGESLSLVSYGCFQKYGRINLIAYSVILKSIASAVIFYSALFTFDSLVWPLLSYAIVWIFISLFSDFRLAAKISSESTIRFEARRLIPLVQVSLPLCWSNLMAGVTLSAPRLITGWILGVEALGLFSILAYFSRTGSLAITSICEAILSRLAKLYSGNKINEYYKLLLSSGALLSAIWIISIPFSILFGQHIIRLAFGEDFLSITPLLPIVMLSLFAVTIARILQTALVSQRMFSSLSVIKSFSAATSILLSLIFALSFDVEGVVWSLFFSAAFQSILLGTHLFRTQSNSRSEPST